MPDVAWKHCVPVNGNKHVKCNYCEKEMQGGVFRMKNYLERTNNDTSPCISSSDENYLLFKMCTDKVVARVVERRKRNAPLYVDDENVGGRKVDYEGDKKQTTMNEIWKPTNREKCCVKISRYIHGCALPFKNFTSVYFKEMIDEVCKFGTGLKPSTYYEIWNTYLKKKVEVVNVKLKAYKKDWKKYECTIMSDGWIDVVQEVGEENVIQVCTDNASIYVKTGEYLMKNRPHLFWSLCATHLIDLIHLGIGDLPLPSETVKKAKKVTMYIYSHTWLLSLMREHTNGRELARPAITLFATAYLTSQSILDNRVGFKSMFTCPKWEESHFSTKPEAFEAMHQAKGINNFWPGVKYSINCASPLVRVLRLVDTDDRSPIGYIYEAMHQAKEKIAKNLGSKESRYKKIWEVIDERWNLQLHAAAYYRNSRFHYSDDFQVDEEIMDGYCETIEGLIPSSV